MNNPDKHQAKALKKTHKAELKRRKKEAKAPAQAAKASTSASAAPTPVERSAAAAEQQVRLRRRQVWIAIVALLVGAVGVALALLDRFVSRSDNAPSNPPIQSSPIESADS